MCVEPRNPKSSTQPHNTIPAAKRNLTGRIYHLLLAQYNLLSLAWFKLKNLSRRAAGLSVVAAVTFGFGMIQVDEYAVAMLCWFISALVLIAKAINWEGLRDRPVLTVMGRGAWLCGSVALLILLYRWTEIKRGDKPFSILIAPKIPPIAKSEVLSPSQVVSLYRLFKEDVPGIKSIDFKPVLLHVQSSTETFGVEPRLHADFVGLSKFVSFYVPSSPAVRDIIQFIADNYSTLTGINQIELVLTKPGEYPRSTDTMKFTGSIVIYHEDALSNADLATLENYYNARRLTPIWRGTAYLQSQILLRRGGEALERLLKVPPAMQTPKDQLLAVTGITAGVDGERIEIRNKGPRATR
jgi:hypothetical protein